jgi:hypothetical protein
MTTKDIFDYVLANKEVEPFDFDPVRKIIEDPSFDAT